MPTGFKRTAIKKGKKMKPVIEDASQPRSADDESQFKVRKDIEDDKKVKPKDVFEGYKDDADRKWKGKKRAQKKGKDKKPL